jgi:hypothetical protein
LEPEDGCLRVYGVGDEHTMAFTERKLESLRETIAEHKRSSLTRPRSIAEAYAENPLQFCQEAL